MSYSTQAQIEAILGRTLTVSEVTQLTGLLSVVDGWIASQLGDTFGSTPSTRLYDAPHRIIAIDPVRTITSINLVDANGTVVSEFTDGEQYLLGPYNNDIKTYIEKLYNINYWWDWDDSWWYANGYFPTRIAVTGIFGFGSSIPDNISYLSAYLVAYLLTAQSYMNSKATSGNKKSESIEGYSVSFDTGDSNSFTSSLDDLLKSDPVVQMAFAGTPGDSGEVMF